MLSVEIDNVLVQAGKAAGVDTDLMLAVSSVESNHNTYAVRFEPAWNYLVNVIHFASAQGISQQTETTCQKMSWGLMQVMGSVARELGFTGPLSKLTEPAEGAKWGALKLASLKRRYPSDERAVISSYNQGSPHKNSDGKFTNQAYVDKVESILTRLRAVK